jgi:metacaspase-1
MAKKAFCVGINDYPYEENDLNGCVNDARAWADLLVSHFDFPKSDVKLITDSEATKANMIAGLKTLLKGAKAGDVLVFTNSSHGSYIADKSGDEPNKFDEVMCPYDIDENALGDDELRELFTDLPSEVRLTVISDSCFSGTVTRAVVGPHLPGRRRQDLTPDDRRVRFLSPGLFGKPIVSRPFLEEQKARLRLLEKYPESKMKEVLLSGCTDREYSYDAHIDGVYHGAMTYYALRAIQEAQYQITYKQLHTRLNALLESTDYLQHPRLEGKRQNKNRQIFT